MRTVLPFRSLASISRAVQLTPSRLASMKARQPAQPGPIESAIRQKLSDSLKPTLLDVSNDSHLHAGHSAMRALNGGGGETHFTVSIVSPEFEGKRQIQRHRLVNGLLQEEFNSGLHALQIRAKTPSEAGEADQSNEADAVTAPPASGDAKLPAGP